ncbi:MAG: ATP-binding cassette domain-containing protein, partial [Gammaproteobacteria bacterium]
MSEQGMYDLSVKGLHKAYGDHRVLDDVSFDLPAATTLAVIGPSGCGKTTLLKCIAGLTDADAGLIRLGPRSLDGQPARTRNAVYLYQEPWLFPHLDVFENVAFGLRLRRTSNARVRELVLELLHELDLTGLERRPPEALSGGQRQRVAFGRALIV